MNIDINFLKNNHQMIHFFGLGFVQLKLDNQLRMHFYHPDIKPITPDEEIHNHRYDFISNIIAGSFSQELFKVTSGDSDFYMIEENCKSEKLVDPVKVPVIITSLGFNHYKAGDSYTCVTSDFHRVKTDFAITRLYRGQIMSDNALVIKNKNDESICPFSKQLSNNECWEIIESCINLGKC